MPRRTAFMPNETARYLALIFICIFAYSCSPESREAPQNPKRAAVSSPAVKATDFYPGQLEAHYLKHRYEFGNITQEEYLENARQLLNAPTGNDVLEKIRPDGDILRYRVSTGEFAVMTPEGRIRTYFKAEYSYWMRQ